MTCLKSAVSKDMQKMYNCDCRNARMYVLHVHLHKNFAGHAEVPLPSFRSGPVHGTLKPCCKLDAPMCSRQLLCSHHNRENWITKAGSSKKGRRE